MKFIFLATVIGLALSTVSYAYTPDSNAPRANIPSTHKWNLKTLFETDAAWHKSYSELKSSLDALSGCDGKISNPDTAADCLARYFNLRKMMDRLSIYAMASTDQDQSVVKYREMNDLANALAKNFQLKTSFIREELLSLDEAKASALLSAPQMSAYVAYIKDLRRRSAHVLNKDAERVLGLFGDTLFAESAIEGDAETIFKAALRDVKFPTIKDEDGKDVELTLSNYPKYRASKSREVRSAAVKAFFETLKKYQNTFAAALAAQMKANVSAAKARNYQNSLSAYLDPENLDPKVYDVLIGAVNKRLSALHKYVRLRGKILGIKDVQIHDLYSPLMANVDMQIPYEEATKDVEEALKPLGSEYVASLKMGMAPANGWVDVYPNKEKRSGAYCDSIWRVHPFVLLNYMNEVDDAFTLAHEFGHAMHSFYNSGANAYEDAGYATFLAEIASTFNETLLEDYYLKKYNDNKEMRLYLLGQRLEGIRTTIFRQTLFAEFERAIHKFIEDGTPVTAELLNKTYIGLIKKYYGPDFMIGKDDDIEWSYIPHFYYKYYVFTYATGLSSGIALAGKVEAEGDKAKDAYLGILKQSAHKPPLDILKDAGLDLTKPDAVNAAIDLFERTIREIEQLL